MHVFKKGIRALGIAESFTGRSRSVLAGVVMRKDLRIDGFAVAGATVGGSDATDAVMRIVQALRRNDLNLIMLSGCVIAWFNIIDPASVAEAFGIPVICVTYEASDGLGEDINRHFPGDEARLEAYRRLGVRTAVRLDTGYTVFIRGWGIPASEASVLCNDFTLEGGVPEPLRVARICARGVMHEANAGR
jgi:uncharacterized protein